MRVRFVVLEREILEPEREDILHRRIEPHGRQRARGAGKLEPRLIEMIEIKMRVAERMDEVARLQAGRFWLRVLNHYGISYRGAAWDPALARTRYATRFPFQAASVTGSTPADVLARADQAANPRVQQHLAALAQRAVDGVALAAALLAGCLVMATPEALDLIRKVIHQIVNSS